MRLRDVAFVGVIIAGAGALGALVVPPSLRPAARSDRRHTAKSEVNDLAAVVSRINLAFEASWREAGQVPAADAPDLVVMRRVALALMGAVPSLEEIRRFEGVPTRSRIDEWVDALLADRRTADYLAERFARAYVGTEDGPFVLFRRRRFTEWLSEALRKNRPYDAVVRDLISEGGLWTDHPATNFVTVTFNQDNGRPDPERLAARVSRAFLGVRIDCAQCHDHPFQSWKQDDFRALAAFFGSVHSDLRGIREDQSFYAPLDPKTHAPAAIEPDVPFQSDLLPDEGAARKRLAAWVTDQNNTHFARATVNRVWALLFGRPLCDPVDDLPPESDQPAALELLADDFASHGFDLHRLIRVITRCRPFRLDSIVGDGEGPSYKMDAAWAAYPMTRLRPEQVAGALQQSASITTIGPESFWFIRLLALTGRNEFVRRYGDAGEDEFEERSGTISQRLLLMNGDLVKDKTRDGLYSAVSRIAQQASNDQHAVEAAYLVVLTRRPTQDEAAYFEAKLNDAKGAERIDRLADLFWSLMNSTEFSWNH